VSAAVGFLNSLVFAGAVDRHRAIDVEASRGSVFRVGRRGRASQTVDAGRDRDDMARPAVGGDHCFAQRAVFVAGTVEGVGGLRDDELGRTRGRRCNSDGE